MKFIDDICDKMIFPLKIRYSLNDLGNKHSTFGKRNDFNVLNAHKKQIQASYYENNPTNEQKICVLYLHSMNGSRLQSVGYTEEILKIGLSFCHFDFTGCGNSDGNTISFGANQKYDVLAVFSYLKDNFNIQKFILWGRSMGSACALKFCQLMTANQQKNMAKDILGIILDSCFMSFSQLVVQIGHKYTEYPEILIKAGYYLIKGKIQQKGHFKIEDLQLRQVVQQLRIPSLFLTSKDDTTVKSEHSQILFDLYGHQYKRISYFKGLHNESRDLDYLSEIKKFILQLIKKNKKSNMQFKQMKTTRFQRLMQNKKNYIFEKDEKFEIDGGCYCSLFSNSKIRQNKIIFHEVQKQRKTENLLQRQKIRLTKLAINSPKQFKVHSKYAQKYFK